MSKPTRHYGTWRIRWFDENGKRQSEVHEKREDAVFKLREHEQKVAEILRGLRSPDPGPKSFDDIADYWLTRRAVNKRSQRSDESIIRVHLRPFFTGMQLSKIGVEQIDAFKAAKAHMHKNTLHHLLTLLVSLLRLAPGSARSRGARSPSRRAPTRATTCSAWCWGWAARPRWRGRRTWSKPLRRGWESWRGCTGRGAMPHPHPGGHPRGGASVVPTCTVQGSQRPIPPGQFPLTVLSDPRARSVGA